MKRKYILGRPVLKNKYQTLLMLELIPDTSVLRRQVAQTHIFVLCKQYLFHGHCTLEGGREMQLCPV